VNPADCASSPAEHSRPEDRGSDVERASGQRNRAAEPSAATLASLYRRSSGRTLAVLIGQISAVAAAAIAAEAIGEPWAICIAILFIGTRQYGLGEVLIHEASHHNLSGSRRLNDGLGVLLSWPFFFTFEGYRRFHLQHHRTPLDDPENSIIEEYQDWRLPLAGESVSASRMFWLLVLRPLAGVIGLYHLWGIASDAYYDSDLRENTCMWLAWAAVVGLLWWFGLIGLLVIYWLVPLIFVFATLNYWSEVGDHYRTSELLTRSNVGVGWNLLIAGNVGYHVVHHKYPSIPWFRLRAAHAQFKHAIPGQTCDGLLASFRQILAGGQQIRRGAG
jgi:fatty acid desaturase